MPLAEPQAEQRPLDRTLHDLRLIDEYAWLKAENWREVMRALAGLTDSRVLYWEPAKWIARLRRLRTNDNLLAFRANLDAGHAGAAGRFDRLRDVALAYAFATKTAGTAHGFCTM